MSVFLDVFATYRGNQLPDIMRYLKTMDRAGVNNLELVLGLQYTTMKNLSGNAFLNDVVTQWLGKAEGMLSKRIPSWRSLVQWLREKLVQQNGIANKITEEHCMQGMCCFSAVCKYIIISFLAILFQ